MSRDRFVESAEAVAVAGRAACEAIESAVRALEVGAVARNRSVPLMQVVDDLIGAGGREARLATGDAFREFERALVEMRACVVCMLVEDDGLTLTEVALRLQISRQAVARLYQHAQEGGRAER